MSKQNPTNRPFESEAFLTQLTTRPGVYQMLSDQGDVLYVGKARNLKKRVSNYFRAQQDNTKTQALMRQVVDVHIIVTETDNEALILECSLIKQLKPRYNILMRDDKSYPYIFVSNDPYPRIAFHRGTQREKGQYFGPFPSGGAVRETLNLLQKLFPVRQCHNTFFGNRKRPCLQYQIKRCSAPCVKLISEEKYAIDVQYALLFLSGKDNQVIDGLTEKMDAASNMRHYEEAAMYRDKIVRLRLIQEKQCVSNAKGEADVFAVSCAHDVACVHVLKIRQGRLVENQHYYPKIPKGSFSNDVLSGFVPQYYLSSKTARDIPNNIITELPLEAESVLAATLTAMAERKVTFSHQVSGERSSWLKLAKVNAQTALNQKLSVEALTEKRFEALQHALDLPAMPRRIECFDISHTSGEQTVASCVVFEGQGAVKSDYRRYNITDITKGDDYAAMSQALTKRYAKRSKEEAIMPDIILIDGGKGQLSKTISVMKDLNIQYCLLLAISKGRSRKPGLETLHMPGKAPFQWAPDSLALHLLQQIRDEAHRFAITGHRGKRAKVARTSVLESIPGIGAIRRRDLLRHFGGLKGLESAGVNDLMKVSGINQALAQKVYDAFH